MITEIRAQRGLRELFQIHKVRSRTECIVGKPFWKRHIDQLRELVGSKVADLELKHCELPEIDLAEPPDAIVSLPKPDSPPHSALFEKPSFPIVSPPIAERIVPPQDVSNNSVSSVSSFPEEDKHY